MNRHASSESGLNSSLADVLLRHVPGVLSLRREASWDTERVRQAFAHEAVLVMEPGADLRAPGAAITAALCGSWDHEPPCPLAPHHSHADWVDGELRLRILFAVEPDREHVVRQRIDLALSSGVLRGPDDTTTRWRLCSSRHSDVSTKETDHAERLTRD